MQIPKAIKILDLSQPIFHNCPAWPTYKPTIVDYEGQHVTHGFLAECYTINAHTGTHLDAPLHFFEGATSVDKINLFSFQGRGVVCDLRNIKSPSIEAKHLERYVNDVNEEDMVLLYTGWATKRGKNKEYMYNWPYVSAGAAQWLVNKNIKAVLIDGMSVGGWAEGTGRPPHEILLAKNIVIVEEVYMDEQLLQEKEWYIVAFPIKLEGFGGAQCRVVAMKFEE